MKTGLPLSIGMEDILIPLHEIAMKKIEMAE